MFWDVLVEGLSGGFYSSLDLPSCSIFLFLFSLFFNFRGVLQFVSAVILISQRGTTGMLWSLLETGSGEMILPAPRTRALVWREQRTGTSRDQLRAPVLFES